MKDVRNIKQTIKRRKENWIGHGLGRNRLLKHGSERKVEGRIEVTGRRGRRRKQLLNDLKEKTRYRKYKIRKMWRTRFGRSKVATVRQTRELINYCEVP